MEHLQLAVWLGTRLAAQEARSALPDAPVVPFVPTQPRFASARAATAAGLHRLADALAPASRRLVDWS